MYVYRTAVQQRTRIRIHPELSATWGIPGSLVRVNARVLSVNSIATP